MPCCGFVHVAVMVVLWQTEKQNADEMNHLACQHSGMNETLSRWGKNDTSTIADGRLMGRQTTSGRHE